MKDLPALYGQLAICTVWLLAMLVYGTWSYRRLLSPPHGDPAFHTEEQSRDYLVHMAQADMGFKFAWKTGLIALVSIGIVIYALVIRG